MAITQGSIASAADYNALLGVPNGPSEPVPSGQVPPTIIDITSLENTTITPTAKTMVLKQPQAAIGDLLMLSITDSNPDFTVTNAIAGGWTLVARTDGIVNTDLKYAMFSRYVAAVPATYSFDISNGITTHISITSFRHAAAATPVAQNGASATTDDVSVTFASTTANNSVFSILATGKTEVAPRSVYFALDSSGSMAWGNRKVLLQTAMNNILDEIDAEITTNSLDIDIGLIAWDTNIDATFEFTNATNANITTLKDFINNTYNTSGGTDFSVAMPQVATWFNNTLNDATIDRRIFVFVTDGENNGGPINMPSVLQNEVSTYAFNIEHTDISETSEVDNTPEDGIPVIKDTNISLFTQVLSDAIFSRRFTSQQPHDPSYTTKVSVIENMIPNEWEAPFWTHTYLTDHIGTSYVENYTRPSITGLKTVLASAEIVGKTAAGITYHTFPTSGTGFTSAPTNLFKGIYGVGYGDRGYGQTEFPFANVSIGEVMDNDTMANLQEAIDNISNHQGTAVPNLVDAANLEDGDIITAYDGTDNPYDSLVNLVSTLDATRLNANGGMSTFNNTFSYVDSGWGRMNNTVLRFQWRSTDQARYFFNTGGQIKINFSHVGNNTSGDDTWKNILTNKLGTLTIDANSIDMSGTAGNQVVDPARGYYSHTNDYVKIFDDNTKSSARRAIYFSIDASGSINTTRKNTIQQSILNVLDDLDYEITTNGLSIDLGMIFWSTAVKATLERLNVNTANIAEFRNFIMNSYSIGGGTDFDISLSDVGSWFTTSLGDVTIDERIFVFMTDGEHNTGSFTVAGIPSVLKTDVDVYAFNIELTDLSDTSKLDNTPDDGIPILFDNNIDQFTNTINNAIFQEHYIASIATRVPAYGENVQGPINGGIGNTLDVSIHYRDGTNDEITTGSTLNVDIVKPTQFLSGIETPIITALKQL